MKASELRGLQIEELRSRLEEARENYFKLRFQIATGQLSDHSQLRIARKNIARAATVLRELQAAQGAGEAGGESEGPAEGAEKVS